MRPSKQERNYVPTTPLEIVKRLKEVLVQYTTGVGDLSLLKDEYIRLRRAAIADPVLRKSLPAIVGDCGDLGEVWSVIKPKFPTYRERREYFRSEFLSLIRKLEDAGSSGDAVTTEALAKVDWDHVQSAWKKALERRNGDPDGAVTAARTMLESVCKHILESQSIAYNDTGDLQSLYTATAKSLRLAPTNTMDQTLRQILSGCFTVVNGMSSLRNSSSDAHGKGLAGNVAERRHAELAVNMAGAISTFLISTYAASTEDKPE